MYMYKYMCTHKLEECLLSCGAMFCLSGWAVTLLDFGKDSKPGARCDGLPCPKLGWLAVKDRN